MPVLSAGTLLYSLDPELLVPDETVSEAILINALFSHRVSLNETHVLDHAGVRSFLRKHGSAFLRMLDELGDDEIPLLGLSSRTGADVRALLDIWLDPENRGEPSYFSSLSPVQNEELRRDYLALKTPAGRVNRLYRVAGPEFQYHVELLTRCFQKMPTRTTVPRLGQPDRTFYPSVQHEITQLLRMDAALVQEEDKRIAANVLDMIEKLPTGATQTRDRLHKAIYGGQQPPVYRGHVTHKHPSPSEDIKDEWRFFINSIYNHNLAANLKLRPALNTNWWAVGRRWLAEAYLQQKLKLHKAGTLAIATPLYRDHIDFDFVIKVRKDHRFRANISKMELAATQEIRRAALKEHLTFLGEQFATHLVQGGAKHLVGETRKDLVVSDIKKIGFVAGPVVTFIAYYSGIPLDSAAGIGAETFGAAHLASFCVEGFFSLAPRLGDKPVHRREFKNLIGELGRASGLGITTRT